MRYHPQDPSSEDPDRPNKTVRQRMVTAQEKDESSSSILNRLKEGVSLDVRLAYIVPRTTNAGPR